MVSNGASTASLAAAGMCPVDRVILWLVVRRSCYPDMCAKLCTGEHKRVSHIVAIANVGDLQTGDSRFHFKDSEIVCECLAGVTVVGQPVNDRDAGVFSHLHHDFVSEGADHDALHNALQVLGYVVDRLTFTEVDFSRREMKRKPSKLVDANIERHACPQRRLLEDHGQSLPSKGAGIGSGNGLDLPG